jgi:tRNA G37 N-methylase TrmD
LRHTDADDRQHGGGGVTLAAPQMRRAAIRAAVVRAGATSIAWAMPAGAGVRRHDDPGHNRK